MKLGFNLIFCCWNRSYADNQECVSLKSNGVEFENKVAKILTKFDKAVARTILPCSFQ